MRGAGAVAGVGAGAGAGAGAAGGAAAVAGAGVFGFRHALRPPAPPVGPDPRLWGHILLFVLTPVIPLCRLL